MRRAVIIVGGGISGLSTAYYLTRLGVRPVLVEREPLLGGLIQTSEIEGCVVEEGPDSVLASKPWALDLMRELGLEEDIISSNDHRRITYVWKNGRLVPLPDGLMMMIPTRVWPVLSSRLLSWRSKVGMAREYFHKPADGTQERSVGDFIRAHYGDEVLDYLAEPLLAGVFGGDPERLSADHILPAFVEMEREYGSLTKAVLRRKTRPVTPLFRSLRNGMGQLISALRKALEGKAEVLHGSAGAVEPGWRVRGGRDSIEADHVVLACSAHESARLMESVNPALAAGLARIPYTSAVTAMFGFDRTSLHHPLNGFGFLVPARERTLMSACTWVGTKFDHRATDSRALIRCFTGEAGLALDDAALTAALLDELREKMGVTAWPVFVRIRRWPRSMPSYEVGHGALVSEITKQAAATPGLHLAGNAYSGIGIPDCIRLAKQVAESIVTPKSPSSEPERLTA